jgi:hypothetical protein
MPVDFIGVAGGVVFMVVVVELERIGYFKSDQASPARL